MYIKKKTLHKINSYILIIATLLYFSQDVLYPSGNIVGQIFLLIILVFSLIYLLKYYFNTAYLFNGINRILLLFIVFNSLYFVFTADFNRDFNIFKMVILNILPFFMSHYLVKRGFLDSKRLLLFLIIALPIFIVNFRLSFHELQILRDRDEVVDNSVYLFIGLLPFTFLFKRKIFTLTSLIVIWYFLVLSSKRSAIIAGILALMLFVYNIIKSSKYKYKLQTYIIAFITTIIVSFIAFKFYLQNEYLFYRMELMFSGDSAGRDTIIEIVYNKWKNSGSLITYLFGFGYNSSQQFQASVAHNDWIDMLGSYGIIGLVLYSILWFYIIRELFIGKWDNNKRTIMILYVGISLISSLFFRWYISPFPFLNYLILPYLIATKEECL